MDRHAGAGPAEAPTRGGGAMRACLATIAEASDVSALLVEVLRAAVERLAAAAGAVWLVEDDGVTRLALTCNGQRVRTAPDTEPPGPIAFPQSLVATLVPDVRASSVVMEPLRRLQESSDAEAVAWSTFLLAAGFQSVTIIPLFVGKTYQGLLTLRFREERALSTEEEEIACLLANQAAFGIQVSRLAEGAITREREASIAKARAEKLALANALLRESFDRLEAVEGLDAFLGRVLLTIHDVVGGHSAALWLADPQDRYHYLLHHVVEDGRVVPAAQSSHVRRETGSSPNPWARSDPRFQGPTAKPVQIDVMNDGGLHHEDERAYLLALGVRSVAWIPLVLRDRVLGQFTIRLTDDRQLLEDDIELIHVLASQAAVALDIARLAEEARQAAVAREHEQTARTRADAMARANAVLRTLLRRLSEQPDVGAFLGEALNVCAGELEAVGAAIWVRLGPGEHGMLISSEAGEIRAPVGDDFIMRIRRRTTEEPELARGQITFTTLPEGAHAEADWDRSYQEFLRTWHVVTQANVPMFVGERWVGSLAFSHTDSNLDYSPERRELALALANQIALALELQRLAEATQEAALAEERVMAARERTDAVERTAETLRLSLDLLAAEPELGRFLGHVLRAANTQLDLRHSTFWFHDRDLGVNRLHMTCDEGRITIDPSGADGQPVVASTLDRRYWRLLVENRAPIAFDDAPDNPNIPEIQDTMRFWGVRSILIVPLVLGAEILGVIGLHNTERDNWTDDEINLAKALGHQATLALQLTRLATRAREGAVLEERNRLAREIHDTLAQGFAAVRMQLELARGYPEMPAAAAAALDFAHQIAGENLVEARRSMAVLKSAQPSLGASLSAAIDGVRRLGQIRVVAQLAGAPEPPPNVSHELLRIGQEAMLNAVRHAEASTLRITLAGIPGGGVQLAVADDGKGFDPGRVHKGFGLAGLRERASAIAAELAIVSEPGGGTEVIATWAPAWSGQTDI